MSHGTATIDNPEALEASLQKEHRYDRPADWEMTLSKQLVRATHPDPHGWRAGTVQVLANALLVLVAFEVVSMVAGAAQIIVTGATIPETPVEGCPCSWW